MRNSGENRGEMEPMPLKIVIPEWGGDIPFISIQRFDPDTLQKVTEAVMQAAERARASGRFNEPSIGNTQGFHMSVQLGEKSIELDFTSGLQTQLTKMVEGKEVTIASSEKGKQGVERHELAHGRFDIILGEMDSVGKREEYINRMLERLYSRDPNLVIRILREWNLVSLGLPGNEKTHALQKTVLGLAKEKDLEKIFSSIKEAYGEEGVTRVREQIVDEIHSEAYTHGWSQMLNLFVEVKKEIDKGRYNSGLPVEWNGPKHKL